MTTRIIPLACLSLAYLPVLFAQEEVAAYKKLSLAELMDLEVTSVSRRPEKLSATASALQVITHDDIRRSGATRIPEALRAATNLHVAQRSSQTWGISARGFNTELSNKMLVMIDGRTVYSPLFSGVFWDAQDYVLEDIDRIEVISGPGGTLWGANAVNGVINITTKSAAKSQGLYTEVATGTELDALASVRYGGQLAPNVFFRVYGKYTDRDAGVLPDGSSAATDWDTGQAGFRIDATPTPQTTLTLQGDVYDVSERRQTGGIDLSGGNLLGRWTQTLPDDSEMILQVYYDRTHLSQPEPASIFAPAGRIEDDLDTFDVDFQHHFAIGERHQVVWGLGYRHTRDHVDNAPGLGFDPERLNHDLYSAFVQDKITLGSGWALTLGTKVEHNDYTGFEVEPSARIQWELTPSQMVWGAVSRAVRMPSRIDRDMRQPGSGFAFFRGDDDFKSETVIAYELGYRAQLASNFTLSASTFYNRYDNIRSLSATPAVLLPFYFDNNLEAETYGVEFTTTYEVTPNWRLHAGYTLLREDVDVKSGRVDIINNGLNETADPKHQFSLRSSWDLPRRVELDTGLRWVDTLRMNDVGTEATVPSYWELDVRVAWRPTDNLELSLVGQNVLHDEHTEYGLPATREEIERSIYAKIAWRY